MTSQGENVGVEKGRLDLTDSETVSNFLIGSLVDEIRPYQ